MLKIVPGIENTCTIYYTETPPDGVEYFEIEESALPSGDGGVYYDKEAQGLYREQPEPAPPTTDERVAALETGKADRADLDAISEAIERGLTL